MGTFFDADDAVIDAIVELGRGVGELVLVGGGEEMGEGLEAVLAEEVAAEGEARVLAIVEGPEEDITG